MAETNTVVLEAAVQGMTGEQTEKISCSNAAKYRVKTDRYTHTAYFLFII